MNYQLDHNLGKLSISVSKGLRKILEEKFRTKGLDISSDEWIVITHLYNRGPLNQSQLVELMGRDKVSVKRFIDRLEKAGYVSRMTVHRDKRYKKVLLTLYGEDLYRKMEIIAGQTLGSALIDVEDSKLNICLEVLEIVDQNLKKFRFA
jgi:DNA-binding MarR family transcriptional regulator